MGIEGSRGRLRNENEQDEVVNVRQRGRKRGGERERGTQGCVMMDGRRGEGAWG